MAGRAGVQLMGKKVSFFVKSRSTQTTSHCTVEVKNTARWTGEPAERIDWSASDVHERMPGPRQLLRWLSNDLLVQRVREEEAVDRLVLRRMLYDRERVRRVLAAPSKVSNIGSSLAV